MTFEPDLDVGLAVEGQRYHVAQHPAAPGMAYGQEGRQATVYQLVSGTELRALKVFRPRFRLPALVSLTGNLLPFAQLPGLRACQRIVLSAFRHRDLLQQYPDLTYAVLMPWIDGPTWLEVLVTEQVLSPEQSLSLARSLAVTLTSMEERGVAHCDLSGPNVMLPCLAASGKDQDSAIELVDVEQFYGPGLTRPQFLTSGSAGYAHRTAAGGVWSSDGDRYAGAVLLAEMLGWCDPRVRAAAWGEGYFEPGEMQQPCARYDLLAGVLQEYWGKAAALLLQRGWQSETLADCATLGEWLVALPLEVSTGAPIVQSTERQPSREVGLAEAKSAEGESETRPADMGAALQARTLEEAGRWVEAAKAYRRLAAQAPDPHEQSGYEATAQRCEGQAALTGLFDDGLVAYRRGAWDEAHELLAEVVRRRPGYIRDGEEAAALLRKVESQIAASQASGKRAPWWVWVVLGVVLLAVSGGVLWGLGRDAKGPLAFLATGTPMPTATPPAITLDNVHQVSLLGYIDAHTNRAISVAFSADGSLLASGSDDWTAKVWRAADRVLLHTMQGHHGVVWRVEFSPDALLLATSSDDKTARLWKVADGSLLQILDGHQGGVEGLAFSPDGMLLATGSMDKTIRVWQVHGGAALLSLEGHQGGVTELAFSPDGTILASGSTDCTVRLWRVADGTLLHTLSGHGDTVYSLFFSQDGSILVSLSGGLDETLGVWQVKDGKRLQLQQVKGWLAAASPDRSLLVTAGGEWDDPRLWVWRYSDIHLLREISVGVGEAQRAIAFSPLGNAFATVSHDGFIRLWGVR